MEPFLVFLLIGTHLSSSIAAEKESSDLKYSRPIVYTNLPPPVLYFPNFPEKPKISNRGDSEKEKRVEYVPFPYKDLPLLIYQSDNQPPVHVVEKTKATNQAEEKDKGKALQSEAKTQDGKIKEGKTSIWKSGPPVYRTSDYDQGNAQKQSDQLMKDMNPSGVPKNQYLGSDIPVREVFPDLQNHQIISIGVSAYHDDTPVNVLKSLVQSSLNPSSHSQQKQNTGYHESQNRAKQNPQSDVPHSQVKYSPKDPGNQYSTQLPQMPYVAPQTSGQNYQQNTRVQPSSQKMAEMGLKMQNSPKQNIEQPYSQPVIYNTNPNVAAQYSQNGVSEYRVLRNNGFQSQYGTQQMSGDLKIQQNGKQEVPPNSLIYSQKQNDRQMPMTGGEQIFYQPTAVDNANPSHSLGISIRTIQPTDDVQETKSVSPNSHLQSEIKQHAQIHAEALSDFFPNSGQYVNIGVYPINLNGANYQGGAEEYYNILIPQQQSAQEPEKVGEQKEVYGNIQNPKSMEMKSQHLVQLQGRQNQGYKNTDMPTANIHNMNPQRDPYLKSHQQILPSVNKINNENQMNYQEQHQNQMQAERNPTSSDESSAVDYQHILIHIPHNILSQQQTSIQKDKDENSPNPYTGTAQTTGFMDGSNKILNPPMPNIQLIPSNHNYEKPLRAPSVSSNSEYPKYNYLRSNKFLYEGLESKTHPYSLMRNPFEYTSERPGGKLAHPYLRGHPGVYASSNLHYTSLNPYFMHNSYKKNYYKNFPGFGHASASVVRPTLMQSPVRFPFSNGFYPAFPDNMIAEANIQAPRVMPPVMESSNITNIKIQDSGEMEEFKNFFTQPTSDSEKNDGASEILLHKFTQDMLTGNPSIFNVMTPGPTAMELMSLTPPQAPSKITFVHPLSMTVGSIPMTAVPPYPYHPQRTPLVHSKNQGHGRYGNFIRKLAALSGTLLSQKLGMKAQITSRKETKVSNVFQGSEYSVEEINDSVLPENVSPRSTVIKTDRQGLDGIPIPLNPDELSRRSSNPEKKDHKPPIIIYKGAKPPVEVYGTKKDIEKMKGDIKDTSNKSSSEKHKLTRKAEKSEESDISMDYIDVLYSMLPDFVKYSITKRSDNDRLNDGRDGWLPADFLPLAVTKKNADGTVDKGEQKTNSTSVTPSDSISSDSELSSSFEEDLAELIKLLPKEEKSDIMFP